MMMIVILDGVLFQVYESLQEKLSEVARSANRSFGSNNTSDKHILQKVLVVSWIFPAHAVPLVI